MKYCPFCGADIPAANVCFCGVCGKKLPVPAPPSAAPRPTPRSSGQATGKRAAPRPGKAAVPAASRRPTSGNQQRAATSDKQRPLPPVKEKRRRRDTGYDGYYDDVKPVDNGQLQEGPNRELIKRIIWVVAGALVVIGLAVAVMLLL